MFHFENFGDLPVSFIVDFIKAIGKRDRYIANIHSISVSKIGLSFIGKKGMSVEAFLPFDLLEDRDKKITKETAKAFFKAIDKGYISNRLIPAFSQYFEKLKVLNE